jgi:opacity protein-like surface antigen
MKRRLCAAVLAALVFSVPAAAGATETRVSIRISIGGSLVIGGGILFWSIGTATRAFRRHDPPSESPVLSAFREGGFSAEKPAPDFSPRTEISDGWQDLWMAVPITVFHW